MKDLEIATREELFEAVIEEHRHQIRKWGVQDHDPADWVMFLGEEVGELNKAIAEWKFRNGPASDVSKEAIQVATLALKIAEMFDNEAEKGANP